MSLFNLESDNVDNITRIEEFIEVYGLTMSEAEQAIEEFGRQMREIDRTIMGVGGRYSSKDTALRITTTHKLEDPETRIQKTWWNRKKCQGMIIVDSSHEHDPGDGA